MRQRDEGAGADQEAEALDDRADCEERDDDRQPVVHAMVDNEQERAEEITDEAGHEGGGGTVAQAVEQARKAFRRAPPADGGGKRIAADGDGEMFGQSVVHAARSAIAVPAAQPDDHAHWKL